MHAILICQRQAKMFELCRIFEGFISYLGDVITSYTLVKRHTKFSQYLSVYHPTVRYGG